MIQQRQSICKGANVCVVVAAFNAERTIARALQSALAEPEVAEVLVVDDASSDATVAIAHASDDGTGRLRILRQERNRGPAAARNRAIDESEAPFIAVLDADDVILPGRFARLLRGDEWDAIADNIAFILGDELEETLPVIAARGDGMRSELVLSTFVEGNISRRARPRGELGFIKPLIRRAFLEQHCLRYDERLRLGEDYTLYAHMLAAGARFLVTQDCGYLALQRAGSLSGNHRTEDLAALFAADQDLLKVRSLSVDGRSALRRHARHVEGKLHHRRILDTRRQKGRLFAILTATQRPAFLPGLIISVLRDKVSFSRACPGNEVRFLFN